MIDGPERIWAYTYDIQQDDMIWDVDLPTWSTTNPHPITATKYRRDDLPLTTAQLEADERVRALVEALGEVSQSLDWHAHGLCRGFSDNLMAPRDAIDLARAALAKLKEPEGMHLIEATRAPI